MSEPTYKKGDRVRYTGMPGGLGTNLEFGDEGIVNHLFKPEHWFVLWDRHQRLWYMDEARLVLVEPAELPRTSRWKGEWEV